VWLKVLKRWNREMHYIIDSGRSKSWLVNHPTVRDWCFLDLSPCAVSQRVKQCKRVVVRLHGDGWEHGTVVKEGLCSYLVSEKWHSYVSDKIKSWCSDETTVLWSNDNNDTNIVRKWQKWKHVAVWIECLKLLFKLVLCSQSLVLQMFPTANFLLIAVYKRFS